MHTADVVELPASIKPAHRLMHTADVVELPASIKPAHRLMRACRQPAAFEGIKPPL
jgi:hypothetical protein